MATCQECKDNYNKGADGGAFHAECWTDLKNQPGAIAGVKLDLGKTRLDLLPFRAVKAVGDVLTFGAKKYKDNNWRGGMKWGRLIGAALRHIFAFMCGEDRDPESGLHHLAHAACDVLFVLEYVITGTAEDDRFKYAAAAENK